MFADIDDTHFSTFRFLSVHRWETLILYHGDIRALAKTFRHPPPHTPLESKQKLITRPVAKTFANCIFVVALILGGCGAAGRKKVLANIRINYYNTIVTNSPLFRVCFATNIYVISHDLLEQSFEPVNSSVDVSMVEEALPRGNDDKIGDV